MAKATPHRCTRQRKTVADEQPAVESSSSSSALPTSRRKRPSLTPEKEYGFHDGAPESTTCEGNSPSPKKIKRSASNRSKSYEKEEKDPEVCEKPVSSSSKMKKEASAKKPVKVPHKDPEQDGRNEKKDQEVCEGPLVSSSKKKKGGSAKQNVKVEVEDPEQEEIKEEKVLGASEQPVSSFSKKEKQTSVKQPPKVEHKDLEQDGVKAEEDPEVCVKPVESSSSKKKGASFKQPVIIDDGDESICFFIGDPVPLETAQSKWPERYTKKTGKRKSVSSSVSKNEEEDELVKAKCHYYQAMVDGIAYNINDHVHVKADDGEPNFVGRIIEFFETIDGKLYFRAQWFYKAVDTVISYHSKDHDERRVFLSEDQNDNDLDCIVAKITIARITSNICMTTKAEEIPECDYYYDMSYSTAYSTFANLSKDDRSDVSSLSTTLSDENCERESTSMNVTLLDLYSGCGAMSTGLCQGAHLAGLNLLTTWAVDLNSFACQSLRLNHPKTKDMQKRHSIKSNLEKTEVAQFNFPSIRFPFFFLFRAQEWLPIPLGIGIASTVIVFLLLFRFQRPQAQLLHSIVQETGEQGESLVGCFSRYRRSPSQLPVHHSPALSFFCSRCTGYPLSLVLLFMVNRIR